LAADEGGGRALDDEAVGGVALSGGGFATHGGLVCEKGPVCGWR
jgi:hypothetical protein